MIDKSKSIDTNDTGKETGINIKSIMGKLPLVTIIAAFIFVGIYLFYVVRMFGYISYHTDTQWNRAIYLFYSIESIALSAAGLLLGAEIRRKEAESARKGEEEARHREDEAKDEAKKAEINAEVIKKGGKVIRAAIKGKKEELEKERKKIRVLSKEDKAKKVDEMEEFLKYIDKMAKEYFEVN